MQRKELRRNPRMQQVSSSSSMRTFYQNPQRPQSSSTFVFNQFASSALRQGIKFERCNEYYNDFFPPLPSQETNARKKNSDDCRVPQHRYRQPLTLGAFCKVIPSSQVPRSNNVDLESQMGYWIERKRKPPPQKKEVVAPPTPIGYYPSYCHQSSVQKQANQEPTQMMVVYPNGAHKVSVGKRRACTTSQTSRTPSSASTQQFSAGTGSVSGISVKSAPANFSPSSVVVSTKDSIENKKSTVWKIGDKCMAPFTDEKNYLARLESFGPADLCSVFFYEFGQRSFVPVDAIRDC